MALLARILVVDDDSALFDQVQSMLGKTGLTYDRCQDARSAIEFLEQGPAQLVIINCSTKDLERNRLTHRVNMMDPELPVLWVVTPGQTPDPSLNVFGIIRHPLRDHELTTMVRGALASTRLTIEIASSPALERRVFQRMKGNLHCLLREFSARTSGAWFYGAIETLSVGGALIRSKTQWPVGAGVEVMMSLPIEEDRNDLVCLRAHIVRVTPAGGNQGVYPKMAVQFDDESTQKSAESLIKKLT